MTWDGLISYLHTINIGFSYYENGAAPEEDYIFINGLYFNRDGRITWDNEIISSSRTYEQFKNIITNMFI
jgi:hypothetical protein|nr:MAG TPA: hypothetical protein [Caudoviricetes sp.]